jgi:hypothetical protein
MWRLLAIGLALTLAGCAGGGRPGNGAPAASTSADFVTANAAAGAATR